MSNDAGLTGWPERERAIVHALSGCPIPIGCGGKFLEIDPSNGVFIGSNYAGSGSICPFYGASCPLGRVEIKSRALALCERIGHAEFLRAEITGGDILRPCASKALELIAGSTRQITILASGTGRGKDFAIAHRILIDEIAPRAVHWFTASELVRDMATGCKRFNSSMGKNAVCVVEDLGTEPAMAAYGQGESAAFIGEALAKWIGSGAKIYISSNMSMQSMGQYGARVASRLRGLSDYIEIPDSEPDLRTGESA